MTTRLRRQGTNASRRYKPAFREDKFRELVLYHADRALQADESKYDPIKLQKLLWLTDMVAYGRLGQPVTGATYIRKPLGPVASQFLPAADQLEEKRHLARQKVLRGSKTIERVVALRPANLKKFTPQEIEIANEALDLLAEIDSSVVSEWTHSLRGWKNSLLDEEIPYETIFLADEPPAEGLLEYAKQVVIQNHVAWEAEAVQHAAPA